VFFHTPVKSARCLYAKDALAEANSSVRRFHRSHVRSENGDGSMKELVKIYQKAMFWLCQALNWGCMAILGLLALMTLVDVVGRTLFHAPISGGFELTEIILTVMVGLGLGNSEVLKKHVRVDLIMANVSRRIRSKFDLINNLVSCGVFVLIGWRSFLQAEHLQHVGTTSGMLQIPLFPFVFILGIGYFALGAVFLMEFLEDLVKGS
jgi:TRAP-type C4-dicarboxylate transport system permease small subunit